MSGSLTPNLVDLYDNRKVVKSCTNCGPNKRQNCWISTVFFWGGIRLFQNIPQNTPKEWCQEAWHQIWLTYDDWKVVKCCTNCVTIFVRIWIKEQVKNVDFTEAITPEPDRILRRGKRHWVCYAKIYSYAKFEGNPLNCVGANWMRNMALWRFGPAV